MRKNDTSDNEHRISAVNDEGSDDNKQASGYKGFKKVDKGSSGVELRYHSFKEYKKLSEDQREELRIWKSKRSKIMQIKVMVVDHPKNKRMILESHH